MSEAELERAIAERRRARDEKYRASRKRLSGEESLRDEIDDLIYERDHTEDPEKRKRLHDRIAHLTEKARERKNIAQRLRERADEIAKAVRRLVRRLRRKRRKVSLGNVNVTRTSGEPHLGGAGDVMDQFIEPFMLDRGLPLGSGKRTPEHNASIGGSPNSDHLTTKTTTDARDFPTYTGEDDARALASEMGITGWQPNSYASHYVTVDGTRFRVQILWGSAISHSDHVHVGVSAA
jgi:hypothetical protein